MKNLDRDRIMEHMTVHRYEFILAKVMHEIGEGCHKGHPLALRLKKLT